MTDNQGEQLQQLFNKITSDIKSAQACINSAEIGVSMAYAYMAAAGVLNSPLIVQKAPAAVQSEERAEILPPPSRNFGENLRALRKFRELSQDELANALNIGQSTISQFETDESSPKPETLVKLADYFGVSVDYLLGRCGK
ncbi:MAG: helix-turn-helix domain-containing protein [Candidatus Coproplasma sp.]